MLLLMLFWRREQEVPAPRELDGVGTRSSPAGAWESARAYVTALCDGVHTPLHTHPYTYSPAQTYP